MQGVIASQDLKSTCKQRQSLAILVLMLYTIAMLKRGNSKTYRLYKKDEKSFAKAPCEVLDIKYRIGQNSQLHSFTASQLHSFTASQLHSFTASQLRGSCAQINLNINYSNHAQRQAVSQRLTVCPWAFLYYTFNKTASG